MSFSPSYTPRTVCVFPTSMTSSMTCPLLLEPDDLAAVQPLPPVRPVPPEEKHPGLVHARRGPPHVPLPDAHQHPLPGEHGTAVPFREKGRETPGKKFPVRFRKAVEKTGEDFGAPGCPSGGQHERGGAAPQVLREGGLFRIP